MVNGFGVARSYSSTRHGKDGGAAFLRLAVGLQSIAHLAQQIADHRRANLMPSLRQFLDQITQAAAGPQQRLRRVAPRHRLDQGLEIGNKSAILDGLLLTPAPALRMRPAGAEILPRMSPRPW